MVLWIHAGTQSDVEVKSGSICKEAVGGIPIYCYLTNEFAEPFCSISIDISFITEGNNGMLQLLRPKGIYVIYNPYGFQVSYGD